jgi:uncharacterized protein (DUF2062 family)
VPETTTTAEPPERSFWQRRLLDPVVAQLTQGITPQKIALTLAVGTGIASFPILGTTTLLCFIAGIVLRLNQPIIQAINYVWTPVHIPLIYLAVRGGEWLFAAPHQPFRIRLLARLLWEDPLRFAQEFGMTGLHAVIVWILAAPFWIVAVYHIALPILQEIERVRLAAAEKLAAEKSKEHPVP